MKPETKLVGLISLNSNQILNELTKLDKLFKDNRQI